MILNETFTLSNGVKIPKIGLGTWQIPDGEDTYNSVMFALKNGYRHIDTAKAYGNEASVGKAVRDFGIALSLIHIYSAISNINVKMGEGNPYGVAFRTHYAQHCFINHIDIDVQSAMAGIYDVGNEMEDIYIHGGQYGIITTKCSPGWPFVMVDTRFFGQKIAAVKTREAGLNIIRTHSVNTSKFIDVDEGYFEKLIIEDSIFENMDTLLSIAQEKNELTQINVQNCYLKNVENIAVFKDTEKRITNEDNPCRLKRYVHGIVASDLNPQKQFHDQIYRYTREIRCV